MTSNSSVAVNLNFIHRRGDTFVRELQFFADQSYVTPLNISTDTFKLQVKHNGAVIMEFATSAGLSIEGSDTVKLTKTAVEMQIPPGTYRYDLQKTSSTGVVTTVLAGDFIIEKDITS